ncbi:hypothetical protein [Paenibacillus lautus]|uniref:hypothetical protein n=1 Tax=Paenibacillus lautus TaxID=1401 RepID=UPI003D28EB14
MNIVCIGSGYVGSVTGTAFATLGHQTTVIDVDQHKVDMICSGKSPIYEPGLDELIKRNIGITLTATTSYDAVYDADVVFVGVGTPSKLDGTADLQFVITAARSIAEKLNPGKLPLSSTNRQYPSVQPI